MALRAGLELISRPANSEKMLDVGVVVVEAALFVVLLMDATGGVGRAGDVGKGCC